MKILIWQTAYIGDVVLATPLIETIRENFPDAKIGFVGRHFIKELLKGFEVELIPFNKTLGENLKILKKIKEYDIVISPHRSMRTAITLFLSGIKRRIGFDRSELPFLYTDLVKHRWELHEVERNLELLKPLGIRKFFKKPKLILSEEEFNFVFKKFNLRRKEYIVFSPFSNFKLKEWSLKNWEKVIREVSKNYDVVITGTKEDIEKINSMNLNGIVNLVGKTTLRELMGVLKGAKLVVANDSSPVHIANALNTPAITVYTATSPEYGFYPVLGKYIKNPLPCSPCSPNPKKCKIKTEKCRKKPLPEDVLSLIYEFLNV